MWEWEHGDAGLLTRIRELEDKVEALRISRRVLMNLIDALEKERKEQLASLRRQNERLQRSNSRYAQTIMNRNFRITELEEKMRLLLKKGDSRHSSP